MGDEDEGLLSGMTLRTDQPLLGMVLAVTGAVLFAVEGAVIKWSDPKNGDGYEYVLGRMSIQMGICHVVVGLLSTIYAICLKSRAGFRDLRIYGSSDPGLQKWVLVRAVLFWGNAFCFLQAYALMPVGDAIILSSMVPILTALLAPPMLGEDPLDKGPWIAIGFCMVGTVLVVWGQDVTSANYTLWQLGALFSILSVVLSSMCFLLGRKLKDVHWSSINVVQSVIGACICTPIYYALWYVVNPLGFQQAFESFVDLVRSASGNEIVVDPAHGDRIGASSSLALTLLIPVIQFTSLGIVLYASQIATPGMVASAIYIQIAAAYVLQIGFFDEKVNTVGAVGVLTILCSTAAVAWQTHKAAPKET